jgi:hypothetical protein
VIPIVNKIKLTFLHIKYYLYESSFLSHNFVKGGLNDDVRRNEILL